MFKLDGKRALVTGATGGLGGEIAKTLHAQGAYVALSGTRAEKLEALAAELGAGRLGFSTKSQFGILFSPL